MTRTTIVNEAAPAGTELRRGLRLPGRMAVLGTATGGLLLGGFLVAAMTLAGKLSGNALLVTAGGLFVIGAALGFVHGGVLGVLGRPAEMARAVALRDVAMGAMYAVPAVLLGFIVTGWIAMTVVALYAGKVLPLVMTGGAWVVGLGIVTVAAYETWLALRNAYGRWPERVVGTLLVAATFGALLVTFLADRPEIWGIRLRVTEVGAVILALGLTLWIGGPVVTLALRALRRLPLPGVNAPAGRRLATTLGLGVAVGVVVGALALPFHEAPYAAAAGATGPLGALVVGVSQALLNEVLLRLFLVTVVAAAVLRWQRTGAIEAGLAAVAFAAVVQVALYVPGVLAIGFPTALAATGYVLAGVLIPALAFGAVYWTRGFGAALLADATAVLVLALLV